MPSYPYHRPSPPLAYPPPSPALRRSSSASPAYRPSFSPPRPSPPPLPRDPTAPSFASSAYVSPYTRPSAPRRSISSDDFRAPAAAKRAPGARRPPSPTLVVSGGGTAADRARRYNLPGEDFRTRDQGAGVRAFEGRQAPETESVRFASRGGGHGGGGRGRRSAHGQGERGGGKDGVVAKKDGGAGGGYRRRFGLPPGSLDGMNLARMSDIAQEIVVALHRASRDQQKGKKRRTNQENVFILGKLLASVGITPESHGGKYRIYLDKLGQLEKKLGSEGEVVLKAFLDSPQGKVLKKQMLQYAMNAAKGAAR